jgi:O-antigen/teichoic acid export membrane protein
MSSARDHEHGGEPHALAPAATAAVRAVPDEAEAVVPAADEGSLGRTDRQRFARQGALTFLFSVLTLGTNLLTGVVIARALGVSGRGELTAILTVTQMVGWAFGLGCGEATAYYHARNRDTAGVVTAWLVVLLPAGVLAVIVGETILPVALHAQSDSTLRLARLFMLTVVLTPLGLLKLGILLGTHRYLFYNAFGFLQPALTAALYLVLWHLGVLSPETGLVATFGVSLAFGVALTMPTLRGRIGRPDWGGGLRSLWYGIRAHGTNLGGMMNSRLDLMIIPAFLAASSVGLYSVATNISWVVVSISAAIAAIVLPAAARHTEDGVTVVVRSLQATFFVAALLALAIALVGGVALRLLYGSEFEPGVAPLRLLLPGSVCYACAAVLWSGLYALNRPLTAAASQALGVVVTVTGLTLFLRAGGIEIAALVSTVAYAAVFAAALVLYRRAANLAWREFVALPDFTSLGALVRLSGSRP